MSRRFLVLAGVATASLSAVLAMALVRTPTTPTPNPMILPTHNSVSSTPVSRPNPPAKMEARPTTSPKHIQNNTPTPPITQANSSTQATTRAAEEPEATKVSYPTRRNEDLIDQHLQAQLDQATLAIEIYGDANDLSQTERAAIQTTLENYFSETYAVREAVARGELTGLGGRDELSALRSTTREVLTEMIGEEGYEELRRESLPKKMR